MSYDSAYYDPAAYSQYYSQYGYDQTPYGQSPYDYAYGQSTYDYTYGQSTLGLTSKPDGKPESKRRTSTVMLVLCILATVIVVVVALLFAVLGKEHVFGTETQAPDDTEAPRRLPSVYPVVRVPIDVSVMTATDTADTTSTTPTAPTQSPRTVVDEQPLVCTIGSKTSSENMFPPDGLCEFIFFDSVEKGNRNPLASPNRWANDLRTFIASYVRYNTTAFGIGFAYESAFGLARLLNRTNSSLLEPFWRENIFHFGILDTATRNARVVDVELALNVLKALDTLAGTQRQQGNPSFIFFAGLIFDANWTNFYNDKFTNLYKPDVFIAQGHYFYGDNTFRDCHVLSPTAVTRPQGLEAIYQHDLTMAADSLNFLQSAGVPVIWALSVTMKGRWTMAQPGQLLDFLATCVHNTSAPSFGSYSEVCTNPRFIQSSYNHALDSIVAAHDTDNLLFTYDNEVALCRKLCRVKGLHATLRFGLAVYDLEYEDFANSCGTFNRYGAFSRLHAIRGILNYFRTRFNNASDELGCRNLVQ